MICIRDMSKDPPYTACPECGHTGFFHPIGNNSVTECGECRIKDYAERAEAALAEVRALMASQQ